MTPLVDTVPEIERCYQATLNPEGVDPDRDQGWIDLYIEVAADCTADNFRVFSNPEDLHAVRPCFARALEHVNFGPPEKPGANLFVNYRLELRDDLPLEYRDNPERRLRVYPELTNRKSMHDADVRQIMLKHLGEVEDCYERLRPKDGDGARSQFVELTIQSPRRKTPKVKTRRSDRSLKKVEACIAKQAKTWGVDNTMVEPYRPLTIKYRFRPGLGERLGE